MAKMKKAAEQAVPRAKAAGAQASARVDNWPGKLPKRPEARRASAGPGSCSG